MRDRPGDVTPKRAGPNLLAVLSWGIEGTLAVLTGKTR